MSVRLVLEDTGFGLRAAVVDSERGLLEVRDADRDDPRVTGAVFAARVTAVDPKLNAAFLDCGLPQPGLIVAKDARAAAGVVERRPVRELLREGQRLVVQGLREPAGGKGARFTADVKLLGFALVHAPLAAASEDEAPGRRRNEELRARARELFPGGRFALRRHAKDASDEALKAEAERLAARWAGIEKAARGAKPGRLDTGEGLLERLLAGLADFAPEGVAVADPALARELQRLAETVPTLPSWEVIRLDPDGDAFAQTGVDEALEEALSREVPLPGGGRLLIEPTAACVAIDVDGGNRAPLEVDLAAAGEIARQVRLRNLGGTIVVDFVDLPAKHERQRLEEALRRAFRGDPAPPEILPMSPLGIVQISRPRRGEPLASRFRAACAACDGTGLVPSPRAAAEALFAELRRRQRPAAVRAGSELAAFLRGAGARAWRHLAERLGGEPPLAVDPDLPATGFAVEEDRRGR